MQVSRSDAEYAADSFDFDFNFLWLISDIEWGMQNVEKRMGMYVHTFWDLNENLLNESKL